MPPIAPPPHALHLEPSCRRALDSLDPQDKAFLVANYGLDTGKPRTIAAVAADLGRTRTEVGVGVAVAVRALRGDVQSKRAFSTYLCCYDATIPPEPAAPSAWGLFVSTMGGGATARERWTMGWVGRLPPIAVLALAVVAQNPTAWMSRRLALTDLEPTA